MLPHTPNNERDMDKSSFRSKLDNWVGKLCLLVVETESASLRLWASLQAAGIDEVEFGGRPGTLMTLEMWNADSFVEGVGIPADLICDPAFKFSDSVRFRVREGLWVSILLAK